MECVGSRPPGGDVSSRSSAAGGGGESVIAGCGESVFDVSMTSVRGGDG